MSSRPRELVLIAIVYCIRDCNFIYCSQTLAYLSSAKIAPSTVLFSVKFTHRKTLRNLG